MRSFTIGYALLAAALLVFQGCATCPPPYQKYAVEKRVNEGQYVLWCER